MLIAIGLLIGLLATKLVIDVVVALKPRPIIHLFACANGGGIDFSLHSVLWTRSALITNVGQLSYFNGQSTEQLFAITPTIPELKEHAGKWVDIVIVERTEHP